VSCTLKTRPAAFFVISAAFLPFLRHFLDFCGAGKHKIHAGKVKNKQDAPHICRTPQQDAGRSCFLHTPHQFVDNFVAFNTGEKLKVILLL
jgi:hypothetical protein